MIITQGQIVGSWGSRSGQVYKNARASPWNPALNQPVPKPIKILVCDWAQKIIKVSPFSCCFRGFLLIRRCSPTNCLIACSPYIYLPTSYGRVSLNREVPLKEEPRICVNRENQTVDYSKVNSWTPEYDNFRIESMHLGLFRSCSLSGISWNTGSLQLYRAWEILLHGLDISIKETVVLRRWEY